MCRRFGKKEKRFSFIQSLTRNHQYINLMGREEYGIGEEDESILRGVEMAAYHGVMTFLVPHSPARGAAYEDMEPPSVERMLFLYEAALPIYEKYGLKLYGGTGGIYTSLKGV